LHWINHIDNYKLSIDTRRIKLTLTLEILNIVEKYYARLRTRLFDCNYF
jgi:hypothetical protein